MGMPTEYIGESSPRISPGVNAYGVSLIPAYEPHVFNVLVINHNGGSVGKCKPRPVPMAVDLYMIHGVKGFRHGLEARTASVRGRIVTDIFHCILSHIKS